MVNQMIKLIPVPKITKRELMTALMEGRRFAPGFNFTKDESVIHWDHNFGHSPVRKGTKQWDWRGLCYLHEITESHWYDNIPECGVLCWVDDHLPNAKDCASVIFSIDSGFKESSSCTWEYATPVLPSECYQEPV